MHRTYSEIYENEGMLLVTPDLALKFLTEVQNGEISLTGHEPSIREVVLAKRSFSPTPSNGEMRSGLASKYVNALSKLYEIQSNILDQHCGIVEGITKLREVSAIRQFIQNAKLREMTRENE